MPATEDPDKIDVCSVTIVTSRNGDAGMIAEKTPIEEKEIHP